MAAPLLIRNRNYRLLFAAGALTNLGDGVVALALPWLATLMTRDPLAIAAVAAASRLPWLIFALPAGVIIDRADRRRLIARADLLRAAIVCGILMLALGDPAPQAVWLLAALAFLLGSAEVLRDNAAQTILPDLVARADLETANGQLWSAEQLTGQFIGPPLAGVLIGAGIAVPFGLDVAALVLAAGLVWLITLPGHIRSTARFWPALVEGIAFMRADRPLLRLAVVLGLSNFMAVATITIQVLLAQEVLALTAAAYGVVLSVAAAGAITGSLLAPHLARRLGGMGCLYLSIATWSAGYALVGLSGTGTTMALALFAVMAAAMVWNVITVSWRQRRIPPMLLGRVNSIYRFFGWGSMPLGALAGGAIVALAEPGLGREMALRAPFLMASAGCALLLVYALLRLRLE
ncbi:MFS-type transporter involved in bile tolerance, Atg22 family [Gemmobacter megaterium]|uniref:MFS-type transporter involved in bile tolerance, Atg22 family n=1 Tax=Gemmobacter megaterium TaxID=1086013 RepID=A0A1N7KJ09_9RHOB|nr:MFS transporter [Gemmobacter megaterium]GGE02425.1 MFS transporter [Gemmobacter megaterium]SIS61622.1 MFS-type transporter involved in bile tolerance, Atg22 family [Gemmobacter megaterium]